MTNLNKMYDGVSNSPDTFLTSPLASGGNIMYVADSSVFGTLPNLAVLGSGANAETVLITSKRSDQGLNIQRAVEGVAKDWAKASIVARNFTNYDYKQLKENIEKISKSKQEILTAGNNIQITNGRISATDTKYDDTQVKKDISNLKNSQLSKASQTEAESGVDNTKYMTPQATKQAIEKLSPKQDLSGFAKTTDIKNKLSEMEEDSTHRTVTDTEKEKWNNVKSTEVVDNLTTDDATKALSAKQGKTLQDNKADKSNISRCKTRGWNTTSVWQSVENTRDLEDWIGDLDKRTRELKSGGVEFKVLQSYDRYVQKMANEWMLLKIGNYVIASYMGTQGASDFTANVDIPVGFRPKNDVYVSYTTPDKRGEAVSTGFTLKTNGSVSSPGARNDWFVGNFTLIYECA